MEEESLQYLRRLQFEKCKGELRAFVTLFDFYPKWKNRVEMEEDSREKEELQKEIEELTEKYIQEIESLYY